MQSWQRQLFLSHPKFMKSLQTLPSHFRKLIQQLIHALAGNQGLKPEPVERFKCARVLVFENHVNARHPISHLPKHQVTQNVNRAERLRRGPRIQPHRGLSAQQCVQDCRRLRQHFDPIFQMKLHLSLPMYLRLVPMPPSRARFTSGPNSLQIFAGIAKFWRGVGTSNGINRPLCISSLLPQCAFERINLQNGMGTKAGNINGWSRVRVFPPFSRRCCEKDGALSPIGDTSGRKLSSVACHLP
jgi:hypothetical protein